MPFNDNDKASLIEEEEEEEGFGDVLCTLIATR